MKLLQIIFLKEVRSFASMYTVFGETQEALKECTLKEQEDQDHEKRPIWTYVS